MQGTYGVIGHVDDATCRTCHLFNSTEVMPPKSTGSNRYEPEDTIPMASHPLTGTSKNTSISSGGAPGIIQCRCCIYKNGSEYMSCSRNGGWGY